MENCSICSLDNKKASKSNHIKSVKHQEKLGNYYCKKSILYMHQSDKISHLNSNEYKNKSNKDWCEDCSKYISDTTRHFQSEIHLRNRQNTQNASGNQLNQQNYFSLNTQRSCPSALSASGTQFSDGVEIIVKENTYNKLEINPTGNLEEQINKLL